MQTVSIKTTHDGLSPGHITLFGTTSGNIEVAFDGTGVAHVPLDVAAANVSATTPGFEPLTEEDRLAIEGYQHQVINSPVVAFDAGPMMRVTVPDPDFKGLKITVSASGIDTEAAFNDHGVALLPLAFAQTFTEETYPGRTIEAVVVDAPHALETSGIIEKTLANDIEASNETIAQNTAPGNIAAQMASYIAEDTAHTLLRDGGRSDEKGDGAPIPTSPIPPAPPTPAAVSAPTAGDYLDDDLEGDLDFDTEAAPALTTPALTPEVIEQANIETALADEAPIETTGEASEEATEDEGDAPESAAVSATTPSATASDTPVSETPKASRNRPSRAKPKPEGA